jgi:hypothetical protein
LIALIINARPDDGKQTTDDGNFPPSSVLGRPSSDGTDEKDQLASSRSIRRRAVKLAD